MNRRLRRLDAPPGSLVDLGIAPAFDTRSGPVVLIADDDRDVPFILQCRLAHRGYATLVASSGDAALMLARSVRPAALVSELYLAVGDCPCLLYALRRDPALRRLPVLAYTSFVQPDDELWAVAAPVDAFVRKPAPPSTVVALIESLAGPPYRGRHA